MLRQQLAIRLNSVGICTANTHRFITVCQSTLVFKCFLQRASSGHASPDQWTNPTMPTATPSSLLPFPISAGAWKTRITPVNCRAPCDLQEPIMQWLCSQIPWRGLASLLESSVWSFYCSLAPFPESEQGKQQKMDSKLTHLFPATCSGYKFTEEAS